MKGGELGGVETEELEAMEAVYGPDCTVVQIFPPHLSVSIKPRTADDRSIQFVEAVLVIKAGQQYPDVPPELELKDAKGLSDKRHAKLLGDLDAQAVELSGGPMLVAICEAATDLLTDMNLPEGDCCFCMDPLVMEEGAQPFMKLLSCFHCFHSDCFGSWWRWLHEQHQPGRSSIYSVRFREEDGDERSLQHTRRSEQSSSITTQELLIHCPVCRMVINADDVAHVQDFLTSKYDIKSLPNGDDIKVPLTVLTEAELARRSHFSAEFEAQQKRGGIIEHKKLEVIQPGMVMPPRTHQKSTEEDEGEVQASTVINRGSSTTSHLSSSETSTQAQGRLDAPRGRTHWLPGAGQDSFQEGSSYQQRFAGRSYRGRRGGSIRARGYQGRPGTGKDIGTSEPARMQSQDAKTDGEGCSA